MGDSGWHVGCQGIEQAKINNVINCSRELMYLSEREREKKKDEKKVYICIYTHGTKFLLESPGPRLRCRRRKGQAFWFGGRVIYISSIACGVEDIYFLKNKQTKTTAQALFFRTHTYMQMVRRCFCPFSLKGGKKIVCLVYILLFTCMYVEHCRYHNTGNPPWRRPGGPLGEILTASRRDAMFHVLVGCM